MNCQHIREAIETGGQQVAVQRHLLQCAGCQQYESELSSLLSLLHAQPRVKAPADFESRLQARLASEDVKLQVLLGSLPAVTAPADFNFRLRARLAQLKAAKEARSPLAWLEQFWAKSFSLGQAATAVAALALVVTFTVSQFRQREDQAAQEQPAMAMIEDPKPASLTNADVSTAGETRQQVSAKMLVRTARQFTVGAAKTAARAVPAVQPAVETRVIASNLAEQPVYDSVSRQESRLARNGSTYYGQQLAQFVAPKKAEPVIAAF